MECVGGLGSKTKDFRLFSLHTVTILPELHHITLGQRVTKIEESLLEKLRILDTIGGHFGTHHLEMGNKNPGYMKIYFKYFFVLKSSTQSNNFSPCMGHSMPNCR